MPSKHTLPRGERRRRTRWTIWELALLATSVVMVGSPLIAAAYAIFVPTNVPAQTIAATTTIPRGTTDPNPPSTPTVAVNTPTTPPTATTAPATPRAPTNTPAPPGGCGTGAYPAPCTPTPPTPTTGPTTPPPPGGPTTPPATTGPTTPPPPGGPTTPPAPTPQPAAALAIGVSAVSTAGQSITMIAPGSSFTYYIRVDHSTATATTVAVSDALPGQVQGIGVLNVSGGTCTLTGNTLSCSLTPHSGLPATVMVQVKVGAATPGSTIVNSATAIDQGSGASASDNAVVTVSGTAPTATAIPPTATLQPPTATQQVAPTTAPHPMIAPPATDVPLQPTSPGAPPPPPPARTTTGAPRTGSSQPTPTNPAILPVTVVPPARAPDGRPTTRPDASPTVRIPGAPTVPPAKPVAPHVVPRTATAARTQVTATPIGVTPTSRAAATNIRAPEHAAAPKTATPTAKLTHPAAATTAPAGGTNRGSRAPASAAETATTATTHALPTATLAPTLAPVTTPVAGAGEIKEVAVRFNIQSDWGQVAAGDAVVYTITLQNAGHGTGGSSPLLPQTKGQAKLAALEQGPPMADVLVVDNLNDSLEPIEVSGIGITVKREGQYVQATRDAVEAGEIVKLVIKARVRSNTSPQTLLNQAGLQYRGHSGTINSNVSELQIVLKAKAEAPAGTTAAVDPTVPTAPASKPAGGQPTTKPTALGAQLPHTSGGEVPLGGMILLGLTMLLHSVRAHRARIRI